MDRLKPVGFENPLVRCRVERLKEIVFMAVCVWDVVLTHVGLHVENIFYLKDFVTWCLYQGKMRFFIVTVF